MPLTNSPLELTEEYVRRMTPEDLPCVLAIEQRIYSHPWSQKNFTDCLKGNYECWVLEADSEHLGHGVISVVAGESHLLNLSIDKKFQRQGLGRFLLHFLLSRSRIQGAGVMFLEVRLSNLAARQLYLEEGFSEVGLRKDYYPAKKQREDALVLGFEL